MASKADSAKTPGTAVAAPGASQTTALAAALDPSLLMEDAQQDLGFRAEDVAIPFVKVAQKMSPQIDKRAAEYIQGLEEGDFFNNVTMEHWKGETGFLFVPCAFRPSYTEWRPRDTGGGLVKDHGMDDSVMKSATRDDKGKLVLPNGNHLVQSGMYYGFIVNDNGGFSQVVVNLYGSQLKKSRRFNSLISTLQIGHPTTGVPFRPAPFYKAYRFTTVPESNDQGSWMGVKIEYGPDLVTLPNGGNTYLAAREFRDLVTAGRAKVKLEEFEAEAKAEVVSDKAF
jgi:hypothetical protein